MPTTESGSSDRSSGLDQRRLRRLLDVGLALVGELDPQTVLDRIVDEARDLIGGRYAALAVLNDARSRLERFITVGLDDRTRQSIGHLPVGRGVLGVLISEPRPLRLNDVGAHPRSYGFPAGHPPMHSFLGVPILIRGKAWGNLYLTDKVDGEFTAADEEAAVILSKWAARAIENARLYETSESRRFELERAVLGLEATRDVAEAIGADMHLERVLELIVKRGRALIDARSLLIMLRENEELVVVASAGHAPAAQGVRVEISESITGQVLRRRYPERIDDVRTRLRIPAERLGVPDAQTALLVPMMRAGEAIGLLAAFDCGENATKFNEEHEQLLRTFATSAANAVAMAQVVETDRLRSSLAAAESERGRWARELHDETLQGLGGLRVLLAAAVKKGDPQLNAEAMREAIEEIERGIKSLNDIITDLRPALLDQLGLRPAIESLLDSRGKPELEIVGELKLPDQQDQQSRLDPELETTVYRLVQEALTNVIKHAEARMVRVTVIASGRYVTVEIQDDGVGFDPATRASGFGLAGMHERVQIVGGTLDVQSSEQGTIVSARLPRAGPASGDAELRNAG